MPLPSSPQAYSFFRPTMARDLYISTPPTLTPFSEPTSSLASSIKLSASYSLPTTTQQPLVQSKQLPKLFEIIDRDIHIYMAKVHPNVLPARCAAAAAGERAAEEPTVLTVWRKSLLFDCKGFTVFDARGDLAYRVDSYASETGDEVVLMDAAGRPAFTVRRRRSFSGRQQWLVFAGEETRRPVYCVRRSGRGKTLAHVTPYCASGSGEPSPSGYEVEGSYAKRSCVVYDGERRAVAEVRPKEEVVGTDVFRLAVHHQQPGSGGVGVALAMAVVVALEQMFAGPSLLRSWSS